MQKDIKIDFNYHFSLKEIKEKRAVFKCINKDEKIKLIIVYTVIPILIGVIIFCFNSNFIIAGIFMCFLATLFVFYSRYIKKLLNTKCFFDINNNNFQLAKGKSKKITDIQNIYIISTELKWGSAKYAYLRECYQVNLLMQNDKCYNFSTFLNYSDAFELTEHLSNFLNIEFNDLYLSKIMNQLSDFEIKTFYNLQLQQYTVNNQKALNRYINKERKQLDLKTQSTYFCPTCNSNKYRLGHEKKGIEALYFKILSIINYKKLIKTIKPWDIIHNNKVSYNLFTHNCFCCGTELTFKNIVQTENISKD